MSKSLSLLFAISGAILMIATAFSINTSGWLALLFGIMAIGVIGLGFIVKAKKRKQQSNS